MRTTLVLMAVAVAFIAGSIIYLKQRDSIPAPVTTADAVDQDMMESQTLIIPPRNDVPLEPSSMRNAVQLPSSADDALVDSTLVPTGSPIVPPTPFAKAIATLVSAQANFGQKHAAWNQLREAGQLEQAIEALKQGVAENPNSAAYPAALGQAQLYQAGVVAQRGGAINEMGMLGMQADQSFDAALRLDPKNWEAQFFKAAAMSHWPLELNKGDEVVQRLSRLVDQQETMRSQPEFAQTYLLLGDQYKKLGQPEYAAATWLIGAQKFPGDSSLQQRITQP